VPQGHQTRGRTPVGLPGGASVAHPDLAKTCPFSGELTAAAGEAFLTLTLIAQMLAAISEREPNENRRMLPTSPTRFACALNR
jgi:hypothetical protein